MTTKKIALILYILFCTICMGVVFNLTVYPENGESLYAAWFYSMFPIFPLSYPMETMGILGEWHLLYKTVFYSFLGYVCYFLFLPKLISFVFRRGEK